jgi:ribosomal protein L11 methyltransferase
LKRVLNKPLNWQRLRFQVEKNRAEALISVLEACLAQAVTTENAGDDAFYEVAFPGKPEWKKVTVTGLFSEGVDIHAICGLAQQVVPGGEALIGEASVVKDQEWERVYLSHFKPLRVGDNLWVIPKWREPVEPDACNIFMDPGLAFGTGTHETTAMCLNWLSTAKLQANAVIDYGCGSGILAIAAVLLGAKSALAIDIDPLALEASVNNGLTNGVSSRLRVCLPSEVDSSDRGDIVIVNILADVIVELAPRLVEILKPGATLLLTGILTEQGERVKKAFPNYQFDITTQGQWCLLCGHPAGS